VKVSEIFPRITPVGESALLLELGESIDVGINQRILTLDQQLGQSRVTGIIEWIPAYNSILVLYNPAQTTESEVGLWLEYCLNSQEKHTVLDTRTIEIPVKYGGKEGPDLDYVADFHGLSPAQVVEKHAAQVYKVAMMGFTPGFAYLMGLDPKLETPRLATPRTEVPAGSVGIAGRQTGIYPLDSPGGWRIIGKTEQSLFNPSYEPYFLLSPGAQVRFIPLNEGRV
jgi:inhibitor of KinA